MLSAAFFVSLGHIMPNIIAATLYTYLVLVCLTVQTIKYQMRDLMRDL